MFINLLYNFTLDQINGICYSKVVDDMLYILYVCLTDLEKVKDILSVNVVIGFGQPGTSDFIHLRSLFCIVIFSPVWQLVSYFTQ